MNWINASKRLPDMTPRLITRFISSKIPLFDFKNWAIRNSDKLNLVEWLDEKEKPVSIDELIIALDDKRICQNSNLPAELYYLSCKETAEHLLDNYIIQKKAKQ